jgi:transglutaminase-like putative cysteine protease
VHRDRSRTATLNGTTLNGTTLNGTTRPAGLAPGVTSLGMAWLIAAAIALLTGAAAVVILLAVGLVAFVAALLSGVRPVRRTTVERVTTADLATAGDPLEWRVTTRGARVHVSLRVGGSDVAAGWVEAGTTTLAGTAPSRGEFTSVRVRTSSAGRLGLVWWRRSTELPIARLSVAPSAAESAATITRDRDDAPDQTVASSRLGRDEVDGVRTWRDGDELTSVHWPATLRTNEFVVRQRFRDVEERWMVHATTGTGDPDGEAAKVRTAGERALATGAKLVVQEDDQEPEEVPTRSALLRWTAAFEPATRPTRGVRWWQRPVGGTSPEPDTSLTGQARWWVAVAAVTPLVMLLQPLGYGTAHVGIIVAALAGGALVSRWAARRSRTLRQSIALAVGLAVAAALIDLGAVNNVVTSLRFLLPQVLVTLVVMQGFECIDRRSARVSLACSAMLTAYAAGIRVDAELASSLALAVLGLAVGVQSITRQDRTGRASAPRRPRGRARGWPPVAGAGMAVVALLAVVPVPEGPAQLTLPSWLDDYRPTPEDGSLVAADGSPLLGGSAGSRSGNGAGAGGYPGFSPTMDINLRGDLGSQVVLRVRSPYPDYWRGQTFSEFDGRSWHVDEETGVRTEGPDHRIEPTIGDVASWRDDQLVQTFYAEVDLPNIVFAATRAERVLLEAPLWARPDGALRAQVVLPAGSAYTVVSRRTNATAEALRAEGDLSLVPAPPQFLAMPASITDRTRELAQELAAPTTTTYDLILSIHSWLAANVGYNLDAPIPPAGADAVDHFLFESRQGFCEQIATATAMLLRSLGIAARVATGYVPSERDEVAGVWVSRASDAHAWVEVRFPGFGWVAFDPTADVPLAGEAERSTIGGELLHAIVETLSRHLPLLLAGALLAALTVVTWRTGRAWAARRRRGRWGVLQDRFVAAAVRRGAAPTGANAELAESFGTLHATGLAEQLDRSAFAAEWVDDDEEFERARTRLAELEHSSSPAPS